MLSREELTLKTNEQLRKICRKLGVGVGGKKDVLVHRIIEAQFNLSSKVSDPESTQISENDHSHEDFNKLTQDKLRNVCKALGLKVDGNKALLKQRLRNKNVHIGNFYEILNNTSKLIENEIILSESCDIEDCKHFVNANIENGKEIQNFEKLSVKDLIKEMKERGLVGYSGKKKAFLVTQLNNFEQKLKHEKKVEDEAVHEKEDEEVITVNSENEDDDKAVHDKEDEVVITLDTEMRNLVVSEEASKGREGNRKKGKENEEEQKKLLKEAKKQGAVKIRREEEEKKKILSEKESMNAAYEKSEGSSISSLPEQIEFEDDFTLEVLQSEASLNDEDYHSSQEDVEIEDDEDVNRNSSSVKDDEEGNRDSGLRKDFEDENRDNGLSQEDDDVNSDDNEDDGNEDYGLGDLDSEASTDDEDQPRKEIPSWAQGEKLESALDKQSCMPPDLDAIFAPIQMPDLSKMFFQKRRRFNKRTSSAVWGKAPTSFEHED